MNHKPFLRVLGPEAYTAAIRADRVPRVLGLFEPRAYRLGDVITVKRAHRYSQTLLAHEYGHWLGYEHPRGLLWFVDVMGFGLRLLDEHDVIGKSRAWRREVTRG